MDIASSLLHLHEKNPDVYFGKEAQHSLKSPFVQNFGHCIKVFETTRAWVEALAKLMNCTSVWKEDPRIQCEIYVLYSFCGGRFTSFPGWPSWLDKCLGGRVYVFNLSYVFLLDLKSLCHYMLILLSHFPCVSLHSKHTVNLCCHCLPFYSIHFPLPCWEGWLA